MNSSLWQARVGIQEVHFMPFSPVDKRTAITYINSDEDVSRRVHAIINKFADRGLQLLAVARQRVPEGKYAPGGLWQFLVVLSLFDPPRHNSAENIRPCALPLPAMSPSPHHGHTLLPHTLPVPTTRTSSPTPQQHIAPCHHPPLHPQSPRALELALTSPRRDAQAVVDVRAASKNATAKAKAQRFASRRPTDGHTFY
ncbi:hypothetical protein GUJ93_ZPchr0006g40730 [Zizania palustris]|uniref:Uncharacterized protein n=1 Tax=Zizania palustris TaxID=103762 RepID=A0A8J5S7I9_ZIZPA|nr:hypothetical protein GUJ93_ZPchr0006g40730 [Zizania palustris]